MSREERSLAVQTLPATYLYNRPLLKRERRAGARPYEERIAWDVHSPNLQNFVSRDWMRRTKRKPTLAVNQDFSVAAVCSQENSILVFVLGRIDAFKQLRVMFRKLLNTQHWLMAEGREGKEKVEGKAKAFS